MSQLVWLEGKHTTQSAHCALLHTLSQARSRISSFRLYFNLNSFFSFNLNKDFQSEPNACEIFSQNIFFFAIASQPLQQKKILQKQQLFECEQGVAALKLGLLKWHICDSLIYFDHATEGLYFVKTLSSYQLLSATEAH